MELFEEIQFTDKDIEDHEAESIEEWIDLYVVQNENIQELKNDLKEWNSLAINWREDVFVQDFFDEYKNSLVDTNVEEFVYDGDNSTFEEYIKLLKHINLSKKKLIQLEINLVETKSFATHLVSNYYARFPVLLQKCLNRINA